MVLCKHVPGDVKLSLDSTTSSYTFTTSSNNFTTPTSSQKSSTSSIERYLHHVTPTEKSKIDFKCAQMIFELNLPFKVVESDVFREYSATLNSAYKPPSAKTHSTTLLDRVCNERNKELEASLMKTSRTAWNSREYTSGRWCLSVRLRLARSAEVSFLHRNEDGSVFSFDC